MKAAFVYVLLLTNPRDAGKVWGIFDSLQMAKAATFFCPESRTLPVYELPPYVEDATDALADTSPVPLTQESVYGEVHDSLGFGAGEDLSRACTVVKWHLNTNAIEFSPVR